jgi:hypothetical protein
MGLGKIFNGFLRPCLMNGLIHSTSGFMGCLKTWATIKASLATFLTPFLSCYMITLCDLWTRTVSQTILLFNLPSLWYCAISNSK